MEVLSYVCVCWIAWRQIHNLDITELLTHLEFIYREDDICRSQVHFSAIFDRSYKSHDFRKISNNICLGQSIKGWPIFFCGLIILSEQMCMISILIDTTLLLVILAWLRNIDTRYLCLNFINFCKTCKLMRRMRWFLEPWWNSQFIRGSKVLL